MTPEQLDARERIIARLRKMAAESEQLVSDIEWWNNNRTDESPFDCEGDRVRLQLCRQAIAAAEDCDMATTFALIEKIPETCQASDVRFHPGEYIRDELIERRMTIAKFAKLSGLPVATAISLVSEKIPVDESIAAGISQAFDGSPNSAAELWMNLQRSYDDRAPA